MRNVETKGKNQMTEPNKTEQAKREIAEEHEPLPSDFREYERELYEALSQNVRGTWSCGSRSKNLKQPLTLGKAQVMAGIAGDSHERD
jgi:hypothetical protein